MRRIYATYDELSLFMWLCPLRDMLWTNIFWFDQNAIRENVDRAGFSPGHERFKVNTLM
jgi:hypothetical protein